MSEFNPYSISDAVPEAQSSHQETIWREGDVLVMRPGAVLPHRCVKCNAPATGPVKTRKLYWHPAALYLLILFNLIVYAIIAAIVRRRAELAPALCDAHRRRRAQGLAAGWLGSAAAVGLFFFAAEAESPMLMALSFLGLLVAILWGMHRSRIVYAARIDADYVRLKGCGKAFLASLPVFRA